MTRPQYFPWNYNHDSTGDHDLKNNFTITFYNFISNFQVSSHSVIATI